MHSSFPTRPRMPLSAPGQPGLALSVQHPSHRTDDSFDVLYVHGSTFGADMSIFYRFDGRSWADALNDAGHTATRSPPSVWTPTGPMVDIRAWWSGDWLYQPACVEAPTLLVRGAWDSLCTDADAITLLDALGSTQKADCRIERATHLMHLESQREVLYRHTNAFLQEVMTTTTKESV